MPNSIISSLLHGEMYNLDFSEDTKSGKESHDTFLMIFQNQSKKNEETVFKFEIIQKAIC